MTTEAKPVAETLRRSVSYLPKKLYCIRSNIAVTREVLACIVTLHAVCTGQCNVYMTFFSFTAVVYLRMLYQLQLLYSRQWRTQDFFGEGGVVTPGIFSGGRGQQIQLRIEG
jgi:hypothetical protein